jgi:hypothetical protein
MEDEAPNTKLPIGGTKEEIEKPHNINGGAAS